MKKLYVVFPLFLLLIACRQETVSIDVPESPEALTGIFQAIAEEAGPAIPELRQQAQPGDEVVVLAKVMGTETPFVSGRALMVVGDEATITSCDLMDDEGHCETPWDACCDTREGILQGTATVQVVDASGKVLASDLRGVNGLKELSRVKVKGVVAPLSTEQAMVINATAIELLP